MVLIEIAGWRCYVTLQLVRQNFTLAFIDFIKLTASDSK
jgi:hypothetical protein